MIPRDLSNTHFGQAAAEIDRNDVPPERKSVHYDLVLEGKRYPPKYLISVATRFATGREYPATSFNAVEAKNYFLSRGFEVVDRRVEARASLVDEDDESTFPEGREVFRQHRGFERDRGIVERTKATRLVRTGKLACDVCDFDFAEKYGDQGKGFIEAHHIIPVSKLDGLSKTKMRDLALVCSNCHRMLHRGENIRSVEGLRRLIQDDSG